MGRVRSQRACGAGEDSEIEGPAPGSRSASERAEFTAEGGVGAHKEKEATVIGLSGNNLILFP